MCDGAGGAGAGGGVGPGSSSEGVPGTADNAPSPGNPGNPGESSGGTPGEAENSPANPSTSPTGPPGTVGVDDDPAFSMNRSLFPLDVRNDPAVSVRALFGDPATGRLSLPAMFSVIASLMGPPGTAVSLAARAALGLHGNQSTAEAAAAAANPGTAAPGSGSGADLMLSGPAQMTTTAFEGAFAPGGAVANVAGGGTGSAPSTPSVAQRSNAAARFGGGVSPDFLANLQLLNSLNT